VLLIFEKQSVPFATQGAMEAKESCGTNVNIPSLYLLDRSDIKIGQFRQLFLGHAETRPLPPQVGSELF
jgi:hypothetical protein